MPENNAPIWRLSPKRAILLDRPFLIGILNITPDSFSDGGRFDRVETALDHAKRMIDAGADAIDIGGESTRPGAARISIDKQIERVIPVIEAIRNAGIDAPITIDTTRAPVAAEALGAGADAINDVAAGTEDRGMLPLAGERACGLILMHRERPPDRDSYSDQYQRAPVSGAITPRVVESLRARRDAAIDAGVARECVMLDPGLGFGKDVAQNLELIRENGSLLSLGHPVLSALSRKSFVGRVSLHRDSDPAERLEGTLALSVLHLRAGARCFRVHDVAEHRAALDAAWALIGS